MDRIISRHQLLYAFIFWLISIALSLSIAKAATIQKSRIPSISSVSLMSSVDEDTIVIVFNDASCIRWNDFLLDNPERVVVDIIGCQYHGKLIPEQRNGRFISLLRLGRHQNKIRIAANLNKNTQVQYNINRSGDKLLICISSLFTSLKKDISDKKKEADIFEIDEDSIAGQAASIKEPYYQSENEIGQEKQQTESSDAWNTDAESVWDAETLESDETFEAKNNNGSESLWNQNDTDETWGEFEKESTFELSGNLWNKFCHDTKDDNEFEDDWQNHSRLLLKAEYIANETFGAVISLNSDYFVYANGGDKDYDDDIRFHNTYINLSRPGFNLKVGNQIVRWGKSDGLSPLDNINPEDLRDGIAGRREDRKLPIPMVNLELYKGIYTLQCIFIPYFIKSDYDRYDTDWALFDHYNSSIGQVGIFEEDPPKTFKNTEAGVRLAGTIRNLDYAFSYLYAREDIASPDSLFLPPGITISSRLATVKNLIIYADKSNQRVILNHDPRNTFGFEFETTAGAVGFRGDAAYTHRFNFITNRLEKVKKSMFQYMVGADYNGPENFYINIEFSQNFIENYDNNIISSKNNISAFNGSISKEFFNGNMKLELRGFYDLSYKSYLYNPKLFIKYWDNIEIECGLEVFGGPENSIMGFFSDNDQAYCLVTFSL